MALGKTINLAPTTEESSSYQTSNTVSTRDFKVLRRKLDEQGKELQSSITVNAGEIQLLSERVGEAEASIIVNADAIETKVSTTDLNTTLTNYSTITQTATQIATRVATTDYNGNTIASLINQTATTVAISASKINLSGYVTLTNLSTAGQTTINGANIQTGTITALGAVTAGSFNLGNGAFQVSSSGVLTASGVNISGTITSTSGTIGGFSLSSDNLKSGTEGVGSTFVKLDGNLSSNFGLVVGRAVGNGIITRYTAQSISNTNGGFAIPLLLNGSNVVVASNFSLNGTTLTISI